MEGSEQLGWARLMRTAGAVVLGIAWPMLFLPWSSTTHELVAVCSPSACATATPSPKQSPHAAVGGSHATSNAPPKAKSGSTPVPKPVSQPTVRPAPTSAPPAPPPAPAAGACAAPLAYTFPVAFFSPQFTGPVTKAFQQQYITNLGSYVETCYPAGSSAPSSGAPGGAQARLPIAAGPRDDATLTYRIRFPVGFTWVKGGKLPGLCGGQCWTGSNNGPGGFATRFMWRSGGAGEVLLSDATTTGYGTDLGLGSWHFQADGQWHTISQHLHMNTPGAANGYIDVTYDGVAVAHFTGITFRTAVSTQIDSLIFSTFFGGHDSTWAPSTPQRIDFTRFGLS